MGFWFCKIKAAHQDSLGLFDEFAGQEILTDRAFQDYRGQYLEIYAQVRSADPERESINDDLVFEIELIKQVDIGVDFILELVEKYRKEKGNGSDKEIRAEISRAIDASPRLRNKKDLIEAFVDRVSGAGELGMEWSEFVRAQRNAELDRIIEEERLSPDEARAFMGRAFQDGAIQAAGVAIVEIMPPASRFNAGGAHAQDKQRVLDKLNAFFERFFGLASE